MSRRDWFLSLLALNGLRPFRESMEREAALDSLARMCAENFDRSLRSVFDNDLPFQVRTSPTGYYVHTIRDRTES